MVPLEVERGFLTEAGVTSMRVVPSLDEVEDGHSGLGLVAEAVLVEELALEGGGEALAERVVVGVADGAHGGLALPMMESFLRRDAVSTVRGQLQARTFAGGEGANHQA